MPSFSVRQLDEETVARLRARPDTHGVSIEEEARRIILKDPVSAPERRGDFARQFFGHRHGVDLELSERVLSDPINISE